METLFSKLRNAGVVPKLSDDKSWRKFLQDYIAKPLNQPWIMMVILILTVVTSVLGAILTWFGAKANPIWWSITPFYFWGIYIIHFVIIAYFTCWALVKQIVVIRALYVLFNSFEIKPKIMHMDGCMGFSSISNYAFKFCVPLILWGCSWAMSLLFMPVTTGKEPTLVPTYLIIGLYPVFVFLFVILPSLAPHHPMKKAREEAIEKIAVQIREWLDNVGTRAADNKTDAIKDLEHKYTIIDENYTTWPFRTRVLRNFCIVAVLPILPTVIQVATDILKSIGLL
ncbi:MAG: hypothetical protein ACYC4Q_04375 [Victivallaceae bacterium]